MREVTCLILLTAKMSDAGENPPGVSVNSDLLGVDDLFDFEAASEEVSSHRYQAMAGEEHSSDLPSDLSDNDDGLDSEAVSSAKDVDDEEPGEEEDGLTRADSALSWKIEHSTGDHKLKGIKVDFQIRNHI